MSEHQIEEVEHEQREARHEGAREAGGNSWARAAGPAGETGSPSGSAGQCAKTTRSAEPAKAPRSGISGRPWFERYPAWLKGELDALKDAGIDYERDEEAFSQGVLRLRFTVEIEGECLPLVVTYPDLYPFFRFQVEAPSLTLQHHQNPFEKNLCLIGRGTHHWRTTNTVASLLMQQLPLVLQTGRATDAESVRGIEQQQAEPLSDYYPYAASMVVIQDGWKIPPGHDCGTFTVATIGAQGPAPEQLLRGTMVELHGRGGELLLTADPAILSAFPGDRLRGCWVKVPKPILQSQQDVFLKEVLDRFPFARTAPANRVEGGWLQIWGVVFPEEDRWRRESGEGWVFGCLFNSKRSQLVGTERGRHQKELARRNKKEKKRRRKR